MCLVGADVRQKDVCLVGADVGQKDVCLGADAGQRACV